MILGAIIRVLLKLHNYQKIPKLPRAMLSSEYEAVSRDERRVLARLGARSPSGIPIALRRAGAADVNELVGELEHFRPMRHIRRRFARMITRALRATDYHPHRAEILEDARLKRKTAKKPEVEQRLKDALKDMR